MGHGLLRRGILCCAELRQFGGPGLEACARFGVGAFDF